MIPEKAIRNSTLGNFFIALIRGVPQNGGIALAVAHSPRRTKDKPGLFHPRKLFPGLHRRNAEDV